MLEKSYLLFPSLDSLLLQQRGFLDTRETQFRTDHDHVYLEVSIKCACTLPTGVLIS